MGLELLSNCPTAHLALCDHREETLCVCHGKSVRARLGTLIHPSQDKIFTKWVTMKDLGAFGAGFCIEFRRESF